MRALLISTYDLGRQPLGLAAPAAWLRQAGVDVDCVDTSREPLTDAHIGAASLVAFYLPMHTATRLAAPLLQRVRTLNPGAQLAAYGLYAPLNRVWLEERGAQVLGPDAEQALLDLVNSQGPTPNAQLTSNSQGPTRFLAPDRTTLPPLSRYAALQMPDGTRRVVGSTDATRGCKHLCRHCPIVPVYQGRFKAVPIDVVMQDIRAQVAARAEHITFGDPDFFNGPTHARRLVERLATEFPALTYDVTIKIEHLLAHADMLPLLTRTGCLFITSAVESIDDDVLVKLQKGHTRADFVRAVGLCRDAGVTLAPTFVPFTPWTRLEGYIELLEQIEALGLVEAVAPIQLAIRLLVTAESRLLELPDIRTLVAPFDSESLTWPWRHPDGRVDALQSAVMRIAGSRISAYRGFRRDRRNCVRSRRGKGEGGEGEGDPPNPFILPPKFDPALHDRGVVLLRGAGAGASGPRMRHVLLLATTTGYQIRSFGEAAKRLGVGVIFASDRCDQLEDPWSDRAIPIRFWDEAASVDAVVAACADTRPDGIIAVGDRPAVLAACVAEALGLPGNPSSAVRVSRNKLACRRAFKAAGLLTPDFLDVSIGDDPSALAAACTFPAVVKPLALSGSRGVMRVDRASDFVWAFERLSRLLRSPDIVSERDEAHGRALIESYIPGNEFAIEGVMTAGVFTPFVIFDKPDPLVGPFFEETIYVTPSRASHVVQQAIVNQVAAATRALGLWHGPVHAECRVNTQGVYVLEVAPRPIGGLCARAVRFQNRLSLEEILLRHALGEDISEATRSGDASGVMMIPIPKRGVYRGVTRVDDALAVEGVDDLVITAKADELLLPLPEGRSYLGFIFASGDDPATVEQSLRDAHATLGFQIEREIELVT